MYYSASVSESGDVSSRMRAGHRIPAAALASLVMGASWCVTGCHRAPPAGALALVNGSAISAARVDEYDKLHPLAFSSESGEQRRLDVLNQVINEEILDQRARKFSLEATDEDAAEKVTEMKAAYTQEEFNRQLRAANMALQDVQAQAKRELTIDRLLNKDVFSRVNVTDADLSTYYTSHEDEFNLTETRYHLARIVVSALAQVSSPEAMGGPDPGNQASRDNALRTIQLAHLRLQEGEDFGSLASSLTRIKTASIDGDGDTAVTQSQLDSDPMLRDSISKLLPGQSTDVLQSPDGNQFAIYKLLFREPAGLYGFNDPRVQQYIREKLRGQRAELLKSAYLDMLRYQALIENYYAEGLLR